MLRTRSNFKVSRTPACHPPLHRCIYEYREPSVARSVHIAKPVRMSDTIHSSGNLQFCSGQMLGWPRPEARQGIAQSRWHSTNLARTLVEFRTMRELKFTENGEGRTGERWRCWKFDRKVVKRRCACVPVLQVVHERLK
jgi:hypothetical protein